MSQNLVEQFESRHGALKVAEVADSLGIDDKTLYRMAARGTIPSFRLGGAVRFDPKEVADWLRNKYSPALDSGRKQPQRSVPVLEQRRTG